MEKIAEAYVKMITEGNDDPEQNARIAAIWKKTAQMSPSEYAWSADPDKKIPWHQKVESEPNDESKARFQEYLRLHRHNIGTGIRHQW